jgi:hypothetical protein
MNKFKPEQRVVFQEQTGTVVGLLPKGLGEEQHYAVQFNKTKGSGPTLRVVPETHHISEHNLTEVPED